MTVRGLFLALPWRRLLLLVALALPVTAQPAGQTALEAVRKVRVGIEPAAAPFTYLDENGSPAGFCVDLLQAMARAERLELEFHVRPWTDVLAMLETGEIDLLANVAYLPERVTRFDYSIPHASLPGAVFVHRKAPDFISREVLARSRLAVAQEGVGHHIARRHQLDNALVFSASLEDSLMQLEAGRADAVFAVLPVGLKMIRERGFKNVKVASTDLPEIRYELHMAVAKGQADLLYRINHALSQVHVDGTYQALHQRWLGPIAEPQLTLRDLRRYWIPGVGLALILLIALLRQRQLLRRVQRQSEALRHSEERLSLSLEGSEDAFWDWNLLTRQVVRSDRWAGILGCSPAEIPANIDALLPWLHHEDLPRVEAFKRQLLLGHGTVEYRLRARDGSWRWIFDRGSVVSRTAAGEPTRVTGIASDITQRKQTEAALIRSQKLLEQTQETSQIGGWEYDLRSGILFWTSQAYRIHDMDPKAPPLELERAIAFFAPAAQPVVRTAVERALKDGTPFDLEVELVTANSRLIWVRYAGRADWDGARVIRLHGCYEDVSRQKHADEERQKLQLKMLEAQKLESLGVLAGGIAHDFNNLLTVILGNTTLAREDAKSVADALDQVEIASQRAADLCRQMLAYAGKSRFNIELLDLNTVVADTVQLLKLSISKNAKLDFVLCPKALPVKADPSQVRQVVMNLVINASESLNGGNGTIRVLTTQMTMSREQLREARLGQDLPPGDYVGLEVEDDGCGMSTDTAARIFDPFFTTKFTGRGLGLAAVVGVVRAHKGAIFLRSAVGRGTSFRIVFPRSAKEIETPISATPRQTDKLETGGTVLVVDDEASVRRIASAILERHGYAVTMAADGYEALALGLAHGGRFSAVLLDLTMPGLDGPGTLTELRTMNPALPFLIMSGFSEEDARKRLPDDPRVQFIPKPFTAEDLLEALQRVRASAAAAPAPPPPSRP